LLLFAHSSSSGMRRKHLAQYVHT